MPELLIFDLDGTLIDSEPLAARAVSEVLIADGFPVSVEAMIARFTGVSSERMVQEVETEHGRPLAADFGERANALLAEIFTRELKTVPGAVAALDALAIPKCVASNSPPDYIEHALGLVALDRLFGPEARFSADQVARPKPEPDVFLHAAQTMGAAPEACLVIEDSFSGVRAARAAGMSVVAYVGGSHLSEPEAHVAALQAEGVAAVLRDYRDLPRLVAEL